MSAGTTIPFYSGLAAAPFGCDVSSYPSTVVRTRVLLAIYPPFVLCLLVYLAGDHTVRYTARIIKIGRRAQEEKEYT